MNAPATFEGGCLCGAVRYRSAGPALAAGICHCTNCQRQGGSAFSVNLVMRRRDLEFSGAMAAFEDASDGGRPLHRHFCGRCGSPIASISPSDERVAFIKAGTLDDTSWVRPQMQTWCRSAQPWVKIDKDMPCFDGNVEDT